MTRRLSHVRLTLAKELRETLRDRRTLSVMVLFPLVVYPLLSLLVSQLMLSREKTREAQPSRVAVMGDGSAAADVRRRLGDDHKTFTLVDRGSREDIEAGRLDALLLLARGDDTRKVEIVFDAARDESREAADRLSDVLARALPPGCAGFDVKRNDLASGMRLGGYLLSKALPLALVLMVLLGAFYPAIDLTAGERERGTLETVLSAPIARFDLLLGKVLAVTFIAALTGLLNLASMTVTLIHAVQLADAQAPLLIPWSRAAASTLVLIPAAFLFGALFVAIGSLARGFKEAQNFLMPVYFICISPALVGAIAEYRLVGATMLVPAMNVTLLARELLIGKAQLGSTLVVLGSTALYGCLALAFAARVYDSERFLDPASTKTGSSSTEVRAKAAARPPTAGEAMFVFAGTFVLMWFLFVPLQKRDLTTGHLANQWIGMVGPVALLARLSGRSLPKMIALRLPPPQALLGAVLIGISAWAAVLMLNDWLVPVPKEVLENLRRALLPETHRGLGVTLLLMAVTPAICEEVLFRGVVLRGLATRLAPAAAVVVTGLLFGMFHLDVWRLFPTAVLGVLLSWVALESGSLLPSMIVHFLNNAILVTLATRTELETRMEHPSRGASIALFTAGMVVTGVGLYLVRRSRQTQAVQRLM